MKLVHAVFGIICVAGLAATVAHGQGEGADNQLNNFLLSDGTALVVMPSGQVARRNVNDATLLASLVKDGVTMSAGTILLKRGDSVYVIKDARAPNGRMLCETLIAAKADKYTK